MSASIPTPRALLATVFAASALLLPPMARAQGEVAGGASSSYDPAGFRQRGDGTFEIPAFFPPDPPVLSSPLTPYNPTVGWPAPPWELADYLTDGFYPQLSSRLQMRDLSGKLRARVEVYGATKAGLLKALREKLDALKDSTPAARERELAALAVEQAGPLAALEAEAGALRDDLISGGFFHESVDWNYTRAWRLNEAAFRTIADGMIARHQVMRAAAYYQKGFSESQRRLLREVAMEISDALDQLPPEPDRTSAETPTLSADTNPVFYFLPEMARFRLPAGLPPGVREKISAFEARKAALKSELQATVAAKDSAIFSISRNRAAEALAKKQEPEFAALETMADEIRRELAKSPSTFRAPSPPPLPPTILTRMAAWVRERRTMQDSVFNLVENIRRLVRVDRISYRNGPGRGPETRRSLAISVNESDQGDEKRLAQVRTLVDKHTEENRPRAARVEAERLAIRTAITRLFTVNADDNPAAIAAIVDDSFETMDRVEEWAMYSDYRTAMFELGLSPAQRRLLFDGALRSLNLPLPTEDLSLRIMDPR